MGALGPLAGTMSGAQSGGQNIQKQADQNSHDISHSTDAALNKDRPSAAGVAPKTTGNEAPAPGKGGATAEASADPAAQHP